MGSSPNKRTILGLQEFDCCDCTARKAVVEYRCLNQGLLHWRACYLVQSWRKQSRVDCARQVFVSKG